MTAQRYRLARGMRLRREADGSAVLLVPEAIVTLNATAAAIVELSDGSRDLDEIVRELGARFEADAATLASDAGQLTAALESRGFLTRC